ncbi:D-alanine--D-alanine ligase [Aliikangiella coralliicola]|uniref:D-alanine--D-alanine ligase n=1 Tax=Aliikangiella coralliicola TaxID=2592383 RepID=A0A545UKB1_9GAMM|nr:D-alanine--D-alanine ligase [Aliikangiella coralliicola]
MGLSLTRTPQEYGRVAVLLGGHSAEREVSLQSGEAIYAALISAGVDAVKIDPVDGLYEQLKSQNITRVFIALHGRDGEDGVVQGFLKTLNIPFTGSDVGSAAISMNKLLSKQIWQQLEIPTARFSTVKHGESFSEVDARRLFAKLGSVLFVKPVKEGSSVGMSKVKTPQELISAVKLAHQYDVHALVESYISGKEYTVTVLKGKALPSISMQTPREFYDYEAKYESTTTEYFCPSGLNDIDESEVQSLALRAFESLGCTGWGRVDFIREGESGPFLILEANTVPGMTESSLVPKAANAVGISFEKLVFHILDTSFSPGQ